MKNLHVLPTEKPSRLMIDTIENKLYLQPILHEKTINVLTQNIYITSDEEIEKDYVIAYGVVIKVMMFNKETLYFVNGTKAKREECKKIILTTNQDLIEDGVWGIEDGFLEWFVKNPSCEFVDVEGRIYKGQDETEYKIIIPKEEAKQNCEFCKQPISKYGYACAKQKEEHKQETLEEAFEKWADQQFQKGVGYDKFDVLQFGAKWQQEQDKNKYSELAKLRNELYEQLPTGKSNAFDLIKIINNHINRIDELI
jgi:hypothetical protein